MDKPIEVQHIQIQVWALLTLIVVGVSDAHIRHNHGAEVILDGATKLGWSAKPCPQNTGGAEHYCGRCSLGCGSGEKRGPAVSWLPAAKQAGAKFIEGFKADKILFEGKGGSKRAVGVLGKWTSRDNNGNVHTPESDRIQRQLRIKAKKVIIACGTLHSPTLLTRSGLKVRLQIIAEYGLGFCLTDQLLESSYRQESSLTSCQSCKCYIR